MNSFKKAKTVQYRTSVDFDRSRFSDKNNLSLMDRTIYRFKLILLGDIAVGKTSILTRYVEDSYCNEYKCNVGVEFRVKSLFIDENTGADLQIWDTSGEEKYRVITRQYYRDKNGKKCYIFLINYFLFKFLINFTTFSFIFYYFIIYLLGCILIFDITNSKSFNALSNWLNDVKEYGPKDINIIIIGNKLDLKYERQVTFADASALAEKYNVPYIEVSALTGKNVPEIFQMLTNTMINNEQQNNSRTKGRIDKSHVSSSYNNISLDRSELEEGKKKKNCC